MTDIQNNAGSAASDTAGARLAAKRAAKAAKKASERGTANPVEEVAKSMLWASSWFETNAKVIWGSVAAVAIGFGAYAAYSAYTDKTDHEAGALLRTAVGSASGVVLTGDEPANNEIPVVPTFASAAERSQKALAGYQAVEKQFASSGAGHWAKLGIANEQLELGKYADAEKSFAAALDAAAADDTFLRFRALEGFGYALEADNKPDEALKRFDELGKLSNGEYKTLGDYNRARVLVATGKKDEAVKVLESLTKAAADKPEAKTPEEGERFESTTEAARTLLQELGGKPPEKAPAFDLSSLSGPSAAGGGSNNAATQKVIDAIRKQLAAQKGKTAGQ